MYNFRESYMRLIIRDVELVVTKPTSLCCAGIHVCSHLVWQLLVHVGYLAVVTLPLQYHPPSHSPPLPLCWEGEVPMSRDTVSGLFVM